MLNQTKIEAPETTQLAKSWTLIYIPELARQIKRLGVHHAAEATVFINQLAFWLQTNSGQHSKDGKKWIYNSYEKWTREQFPSLSPWQFGVMVRDLEALGIIEKSCYANLRKHLVNKLSGLWHPDQTQSWITLDLERLLELTGYNPFDKTWEPLHRADVANTMMGDCNHNDAKLRSQQPSIYKENSFSTQKGNFEKEKCKDVDQENKILYQWNIDYDPWNDDLQQDSHDIEKPNREVFKDDIDTSEGDYSAAPLEQIFEKEFLSDEPATFVNKPSSAPGQGFKDKPKPNPKENSGVIEREVWEIAPSRPYSVFLNWWADRKYKPQGGHWETDARGNAYSEFYRQRDRTTVAIFPEFLEYMQQVALNCDQLLAAGIKAILPSCFVAKPDATHANVEQLMKNISQLVERGAQVALPTNSVTPACTQSMNFAIAAGSDISALSKLEAVVPEQITPVVENDLELLVARKQMIWNTTPALRDSVKRWVARTPGVEITKEGVVLAPLPKQEE
jgi:hypothetical protein